VFVTRNLLYGRSVQFVYVPGDVTQVVTSIGGELPTT